MAAKVTRGVTGDELIDYMLESRREISELEYKLQLARRSTTALRFIWTSLGVVVVVVPLAVIFTWGAVDLASLVIGAIAYVLTCLAGICVARLPFSGYRNYGNGNLYEWHWPPNPRLLEIELAGLVEKQALYLSGERVDTSLRQYTYRSEMQREVNAIRSGSRYYRNVNNMFQSVIIIGSLATTTVASLNNGSGAMKWIAVVLSFAVGISAGFMGYFKYRERAFYLQQTADDIEEQMNAYELALPPYISAKEEDRIKLLTEKVEAIRVAQQRREQQLDQPKTSKDES